MDYFTSPESKLANFKAKRRRAFFVEADPETAPRLAAWNKVPDPFRSIIAIADFYSEKINRVISQASSADKVDEAGAQIETLGRQMLDQILGSLEISGALELIVAQYESERELLEDCDIDDDEDEEEDEAEDEAEDAWEDARLALDLPPAVL